MIPIIKGLSMVPLETYLRFCEKGDTFRIGVVLETVNGRDKSSEKFRGKSLHETLLAYPMQKYLVPKVQFLMLTLAVRISIGGC